MSVCDQDVCEYIYMCVCVYVCVYVRNIIHNVYYNTNVLSLYILYIANIVLYNLSHVPLGIIFSRINLCHCHCQCHRYHSITSAHPFYNIIITVFNERTVEFVQKKC